VSALQSSKLHLDGSTPQRLALHLDVSGQQEPELLLDVCTPQGPELHLCLLYRGLEMQLDVSGQQEPELLLDVTTPQGPELHTAQAGAAPGHINTQKCRYPLIKYQYHNTVFISIELSINRLSNLGIQQTVD